MSGREGAWGGTRFVPRVYDVHHDDVRRDATTEVDEVVIVRGRCAISAITGSEVASTGGTESGRPENSGAESDGYPCSLQ